MSAHVYIIKMCNNHYYVGSTKDLENRRKEHVNGEVKTTKGRRPLELVYHKEFETFAIAMKTEKNIKKMKSKKYIENLISCIK